MPRNMSNRRVSFSPDVNDRPPLFTTHHGGTTKNRPAVTGVWSYDQSSSKRSSSGFSPVGFLKRLGAKVARALRFVSKNRKSLRKVSSSSLSTSSSSSSSTLVRSRSCMETLDSHRAEAIEDCIEFLRSSSCSRRSNSAATTSY